jgi:hypothetical protein
MASLAAALAGGDVPASAGWATEAGRVGAGVASSLTGAKGGLFRAMLNAGIRYSAAQTELYAAIAADAAAQATLATLAGKLGGAAFLGGAAPSAEDAAVLGGLYDLLTLGAPAIAESHPAVAKWTAAVAAAPAVAAALVSRGLATGGVARVGGQVDLRASPVAVAVLADTSVARNAGHKKAASQRDAEDAKKAATTSAPAPAAAAPAPAAAVATVAATATQPAENLTLPSLPVDDRIARSLRSLETAGITGVPLVRHAPAENVDALLAALDGKDGVKAKNLFVKAKKEKAPGDSRTWLVLAAYDTKVDLVALASKLGYGKIVIRFADAESLTANLGVAPGNVSPLALANDTALQVRAPCGGGGGVLWVASWCAVVGSSNRDADSFRRSRLLPPPSRAGQCGG